MRLLAVGVATAVALMSSLAQAQDDTQAIKKRILEAVEKKLKEEEARILKEIEKIIDEELAKSKGVKPPKPDPKPDPVPPKPDPAKPKGRGFLGIQPGELTQEELDDLGIKGGVRIGRVVAGASAEKAGIQDDDIILTIDGEAVTDPSKLPGVIQKKGAGATITVKILRDKKEKEIKVTLMRHPDDPEPAPEPPKADPPKKEPEKSSEPPKSEGDLRDRIRKFMDKEAEKKKDDKSSKPKEESPAIEDSMVERVRGVLKDLGADVEQFLEKGKDGLWRIRDEYSEMFKGMSPSELFKKIAPGLNEEKPEAKKDEAKPAPAAKKAGTGWLGVMPEELSDEVRAQLDIEDGVGISVAETRAGSPAEKSLQKGDILLKVDGKAIKGEEGLRKFVAGAAAGQEIELTVLRKGKQQKVKLTLGERKD